MHCIQKEWMDSVRNIISQSLPSNKSGIQKEQTKKLSLPVRFSQRQVGKQLVLQINTLLIPSSKHVILNELLPLIGRYRL